MKKLLLALVLVGLVAIPLSVAAAVALFPHVRNGRPHPGPAAGTAGEDDEDAAGEPQVPTVKTIRPRRDPSFTISVDEPAYVEPYYRAELLARVAGPVS